NPGNCRFPRAACLLRRRLSCPSRRPATPASSVGGRRWLRNRNAGRRLILRGRLAPCRHLIQEERRSANRRKDNEHCFSPHQASKKPDATPAAPQDSIFALSITY